MSTFVIPEIKILVEVVNASLDSTSFILHNQYNVLLLDTLHKAIT
jgi:hypothetical protein